MDQWGNGNLAPSCSITSTSCAYGQAAVRPLRFLSMPEIGAQTFGHVSSDLLMTLDYPLDSGMDLVVTPVSSLGLFSQ